MRGSCCPYLVRGEFLRLVLSSNASFPFRARVRAGLNPVQLVWWIPRTMPPPPAQNQHDDDGFHAKHRLAFGNDNIRDPALRWSAEGKPERAVALMRRLQSHGFEPSLYTYETIVWGFAKVGKRHTSLGIRSGRQGMGAHASEIFSTQITQIRHDVTEAMDIIQFFCELVTS